VAHLPVERQVRQLVNTRAIAEPLAVFSTMNSSAIAREALAMPA
jgi:hypothetical protein